MAKKHYGKTVEQAKDIIRDWSDSAGYTMISDSPFSVYLVSDGFDFDIHITLIELLMSALRLSKKKVTSLISVLSTKGRVYILFKRRCAD